MPTYPTYKLGEICIIERGGSPRPIKDYLTKDDNGLNWIKIGDATLSNKYIYTTAEKIKPEGLSKTRMVESGDLILSNSMSFGHPYIMRTSGCIHDGWVVFRLNKEIIDEEYLYNILNSNEVYAQFNHLATGSTVKNLNIDRIKEVVIPLPPLPTQRAIVARIESLFAELDKAAVHLRTAQQQLKTYRQAVLNHWLNNDDEKWEVVKLGEVIEVKDGTHDTPKYVQSGIPFVTQKNITESGISFSNVQYITEQDHFKFHERSNVAQNDILIAMIGANRGNATIVNTDIVFSIKNVGLLKYTPNVFNNKFLLFYLRSQKSINYIKKQSKGGAQEFIGLKELRNFPVSLPPLSDQHRIVQEIESRLSQAEAAEASIAEALQKTEALRQSILKKAFSGELVPVLQ